MRPGRSEGHAVARTGQHRREWPAPIIGRDGRRAGRVAGRVAGSPARLEPRASSLLGSAPGPITPGWRLRPARTTHRWRPLRTARLRWIVDQTWTRRRTSVALGAACVLAATEVGMTEHDAPGSARTVRVDSHGPSLRRSRRLSMCERGGSSHDRSRKVHKPLVVITLRRNRLILVARRPSP